MSRTLNDRAGIARMAITLGVAATISLASAVPAQAFFFLADPKVQDGLKHFFECKDLLFTDPKKHAELCLPNNVKTPFSSIETLHRNGPPVLTCRAPAVLNNGRCVTPPPPPPSCQSPNSLVNGVCKPPEPPVECDGDDIPVVDGKCVYPR